MRLCSSEYSRGRSPHIDSKPSADAKHLTWSHKLKEQTNRKKSSIIASRSQSECNRCVLLSHKSSTSQFIDKISDYMNEGNLIKLASLGSEVKDTGCVSMSSSLATNASIVSESDDTLSPNHQSEHHKLVSMSSIPTVKGSSTATTSLQDIDNFSVHRTNGRSFPTCYHPLSSIEFQCRELKLHLKKSTVPYKIVLGIEYNLNRLSMDMLAAKGPEYYTLGDARGAQSVVRQTEKLKALKATCKSLSEEKKALEDAISAHTAEVASWKSKQNDLNEAVANLTSQLEESIKKADEYGKALTNSAQLMAELQEENKSLPLLRTMVSKHNEHMKAVVRDNELMRLEVQKMRLERETFKMLLQNKDIEIQKFGDEIKAIQLAATEQFAQLQSINQEHRLHHRLTSRSVYPPTFSSSEQGTPRSRSRSETRVQSRDKHNGVWERDSMETRDHTLEGRDKHNGVWEGGGETATFPICSSPSSENNSLSLGPSQSWNQISPITSEINQAQSMPLCSKASWDVEQGPYAMSENTLHRLQFLKMDATYSSIESNQMQGQVVSIIHRKPQAADSSQQEFLHKQTPQTNTVPNPPKLFLDLLPPPSELSQWTDSCDEVSFSQTYQ